MADINDDKEPLATSVVTVVHIFSVPSICDEYVIFNLASKDYSGIDWIQGCLSHTCASISVSCS